MSLRMRPPRMRHFDVLIVGASGYTGTHLAEYLLRNYAPKEGDEIVFGLAGRNMNRLVELHKRLRSVRPDPWVWGIQLVTVDILNEASVNAAVRKATVVASVVGPYDEFGETLVRACVENGTHYVDITGETPFIQDMIDRYHLQAVAMDTFIVPSCGFDSIPSDLGTHLLALHAEEEFGAKLGNVRCYLTGGRDSSLLEDSPGADGAVVRPGAGTLLSLLGVMSTVRGWKALLDPFVLCDQTDLRRYSKRRARHPLLSLLPGYDGRMRRKKWIAHFPMALVNEKTVRRSSVLLHELYGPNFEYREAFATDNALVAVGISLAAALLYLITMIPGVAFLCRRFLVPPSSQTPPLRTDDYKPGNFRFELIAETDEDEPETIRARVEGVDDAGFSETSKMMGEAAVALAIERNRIVEDSGMSGGVVTPAVLGITLIQRLRVAGMKLSISKPPKKKRK